MDKQLNLLDLPDLVLEEIFKSCLRSLDELKLCCKFFKNFIDSHSRLKRPPPNILNILIQPYMYDVEDFMGRKDELLEQYNSNEIYDSIVIEYDSYFGHYNSEETNPEITVEMILEKHAKLVKDFKCTLEYLRGQYVVEALRLMKPLKNLEKAVLEFSFCDNSHYYTLDDDEFSNDYRVQKLNFPHLRKLTIKTEVSWPFLAFKSCKNIEKLEVYIEITSYIKSYKNFYKIVKNSKTCLKSLTFHTDEMEADDFQEFFDTLLKTGLDLHEFSLKVFEMNSAVEVNKLCKFLETQKNLQRLEIDTIIPTTFIQRFQKTLLKLQHLKKLNLTIFTRNSRKTTVKDPKYWNLGKLEKIKICKRDGLSKDQVDYIFHLPSQKLQGIELIGKLDIGGEAFEKILKNYQSLTNLIIENGGNMFSSDNIFTILQFLKKLKFLKFTFPPDNALDESKFDGPDNLMLPEVEKVHFEFNDSITNDHLLKFLALMSNLKEFRISIWKNLSQSTLEIVSKELPNLSELEIYSTMFPKPTFRLFMSPLCLQDFEMMKTTVEKYNSKPREFKFNGMLLQTYIEGKPE